MELHFATIWEAIAGEQPDAPAVVQAGVRRTWGDYEHRAARFAAGPGAAGIGPDDKVALYLHNCPEYAEAHFGALKARAVPVNVNYRYVGDEVLYLLDNSEARAVVFHSSLGDQIDRIARRARGVKLWI